MIHVLSLARSEHPSSQSSLASDDKPDKRSRTESRCSHHLRVPVRPRPKTRFMALTFDANVDPLSFSTPAPLPLPPASPRPKASLSLGSCSSRCESRCLFTTVWLCKIFQWFEWFCLRLGVSLAPVVDWNALASLRISCRFSIIILRCSAASLAASSACFEG